MPSGGPQVPRLVLFVPDFSYLGITSLFSEGALRVHAEVADSQDWELVTIPLKYSLGGKLTSMALSLVRGGFWAASPVLNHFGGAKAFAARPGDKLVVSFHTTWWLVRQLVGGLKDAEVFLIVHNMESECRRSRGSIHFVNRLFPIVEKWNVESLRRLDQQLGGCYVGCVSFHDMETLRDLGIPARELRFVGWTTLLRDDDVADGRRALASERTAERTLLFVGNGGNPDNRAGLSWFLEAVAPLLRQCGSWRLVLAGPHWDGFDTTVAPVAVERVGFIERLSSVLTRGMIGINPDRSGVGVKTKMLDYIAVGLPVVSTTLGVLGLPPQARVSFRASNEPSEWASMIEGLRESERWSAYSRDLLELSNRYATRGVFAERLADFLLHRPEQEDRQPAGSGPGGSSAISSDGRG